MYKMTLPETEDGKEEWQINIVRWNAAIILNKNLGGKDIIPFS